jgi:DNA repair protein RadD
VLITNAAAHVAPTTQHDLNVIRNIYQQKIVDDVRDSLRKGHKRVLIHAHPASGKSHVFEKIAEAAIKKNKTIFYVAPRINLVLDIHKKVVKNGMHCGFMMSGCDRDYFAKVQLCCTPSLLNRIKGSQGKPHADILVIDEAHVEQESVLEVVSHYPNAVIVSMTGTPLPGMDKFVDAVVKGPTMGFLTENGLLTPVTYVKARIEDVPAELSGKRASKLIGEPVSTWIEHGRGLPTVLFAPSVASSMELCERFKACGVAAEHMDAETRIEDRKKMFAGLESGELKVLCTVETFSYGVDVPIVSCAILAYTVEQRIKKSPETLAAYVQKISRIIRTYPGKDTAIVIDHSGLYDVFGRIDVEHPWPIETDGGKEKLEAEMEKVAEKSRIIECRACGVSYESKLGECPACHEPATVKRARNVEHIDARLGVVGPDGKVSRSVPSEQETRRFYEDAVRVCVERGWKKGKAYHLFKKRFPGYNPPRISVASGGAVLPANRALLKAYLDNERKAYHARQRGIERASQRGQKEGTSASS